MSASMGSLVVEIAADMARFQADMGKAQKVANDTMSQIQRDVSRSITAVEGTFKTLSMAAAGVTAFLAGGAMFKDVINTTNAVAGEVGKLSRSLGITAQQASVLRVALDDAFLSAEDMQAGANRITKQLLSNEDAFKKLGVATRDSNGNYRNTVDIMSDVNSHLAKLKAGTDQNVAGMSVYGKSWGEVRGLMKLTSEAMEEAKDRAERLHLVLGPEQVAASRQYKLAMKDLEDVNESLKLQIGKELIPALTDLSTAFGDAGTSAAGFFAKVMHEGVTEMGSLKSWAGRQMGRIPQDKEIGNWKEYQARQDAEERLYLWNMEKWADKRGGLTTNINRAIVPVTAKGDRIDPDAIGKASTAANEAAAAAEKLRNEYNKGVQSYNHLVDTYNAALPTLSETERAIAKIREEVARLSKDHPEQAADAQRIGKKIEEQLRLAEARKLDNAEMKESIRLMEEMNKDWSLQGLGKGLEPTAGFMSYGKARKIGSLMGNDDFGKPKYDLLGAVGKSPAVTQKQEEMDQLKEIQKRGEQEILSMKMGAASQGIALMQQVAGESKGMAVAALVAQKSLAVAQILLNANVAASAALLPPPVGLGPIAGQVLAAEIRGMGYLSAGLAAATGVAELGNTLSGRRALGGPVRSGETYLVGENGPELMTVGASGFVTPNDRIGGTGVTISQHFNFAAGTSDEVRQQMRMMGKQAKEEAKAEILASMQRGGTFAKASGRMR